MQGYRGPDGDAVKRRVVFYDDHPRNDGGATIWTRTVAGELSRRAWDVCILFPDEGVAVTRARESGLPVRIVRAPALLRRYGRRLRPIEGLGLLAALPWYWLRLASRLRSADIVHVADHRGLVLAGPAARLVHRPVVWHVHTSHGSRLLNRLGSALAAAVVVPSASTAANLPGLRARARQLPNAVPDRLFTLPDPRPAAPQVLVTAGRLHPVKGFDVLLAAARLLRDDGLDFRLRIVGGVQPGHEAHAAELQQLCADFDLERLVTFTGEQRHPEQFWRDASVYIQPSRQEPGGLAALEAMATGLPVVASAVGGLPDVVIDGQTGRLVSPGDATELASAIAELLAAPSRAQAMGRAARQRARAFSVTALGDRVLDLYASVAA
jgi:glycosyltransferase involved in cell wall biosynthesis